MKSYKDIGIPFKQINFGETDRIVSILTKYHGRIDAIAKGVRKLTSRKGGNIDIMTLSKYSFAKGENLDIVTEVEQIHGYEVVKEDLNTTLSLFFLCELLDVFLQKGSEEREIFSLLLNILNLLEQSKTSLAVYAFALKLLTIQGFAPNVSECLVCKEPFLEDAKRYVYKIQAGLVCSKHASGIDKPVSNKALKVLRFITTCEIGQSRQVNISDKLEKELRMIFETWIESATDRESKSTKYMKNI